MKMYQILLIGILMPISLKAQEIAIIDQGFNSRFTNNGSFSNPLCFGEGDIWFANRGSFPLGINQGGGAGGDIKEGDQVAMAKIGLCFDSHFGGKTDSASVPKFRSLPASNNFNQPYTRAALVLNGLIPVVEFNAPFQNISFGAGLRHGTDVANAAHEFDSNVRRKMVQVYDIDDRQEDPNDCSANPSRTISQSSGVIGNIGKIINAFRDIARNPDGVDAINMSIVFRQPFCLRQDGDLEPDLCARDVGLDEVRDLGLAGIPLVVGLDNKDIEPEEVTWPACLPGVIKVGAENDNDNLGSIGGIGIGGMDVDFYAKNEVSANKVNGIKRAGNSMAAPRIATAYALLKEAVPNSTVVDRTKALQLGASRTNTYRFNGEPYKRPYVRKGDIPDAIAELRQLVRGNLDNIFFNDSEEYGPAFGGVASDYSFEIDFDKLIASNKLISPENRNLLTKEVTVSPVRDVVLSFDAKMLINVFNQNGFDIFINNTKRESTTFFDGERNIEFTFNRTFFDSGKNTIRIVPRIASRPWGLTNIKAEFTPVVELALNQLDANDYGSEEDPQRPTGLRVSFEIVDTNSDVLFFVTGWGLRDADEVQVYLNGIEYGFLTKQDGVNDRYSPQDTFTFNKADLADGSNVIEFVQKEGETKWGVKNMFVTLDSLSPILPLGLKSTIMYGNNYGTNEHPIRLDATFTATSEHDHNISWRGFDIDRSTDIDVYLNNLLIKNLRTTNNNGLGVTESITLASRLFQAGVNTLSFRVTGDAHDTTWGVTDLIVRTSAIIDLDNEDNLEKDYGYFAKYRGFAPSGWKQLYSSQEYQTRLHATFSSTATQDKTIQITGWDVDAPEELGIYVNGTFLRHVNSSDRSSVYSEVEALRIPKANLVQGLNTISFRTNVLTGFNDEKWGVFFGKGSNIISFAPIYYLLLDEGGGQQ